MPLLLCMRDHYVPIPKRLFFSLPLSFVRHREKEEEIIIETLQSSVGDPQCAQLRKVERQFKPNK